MSPPHSIVRSEYNPDAALYNLVSQIQSKDTYTDILCIASQALADPASRSDAMANHQSS